MKWASISFLCPKPLRELKALVLSINQLAMFMGTRASTGLNLTRAKAARQVARASRREEKV